MSRKILICPGFAKCGTTFLYATLKKSSVFCVAPGKKEMKYFVNQQTSRPEYEKRFERPNHPEFALKPVLFEASPPYLQNSPIERRRTILARIHAAAPDAKILLCIRHPVARAFSHYVYKLHQFAQYGRNRRVKNKYAFAKEPYLLSFDKSPDWQIRYAENLELLFERFEPENIMIFALERDAKQFGTFYRDLCDFVGEESNDEVESRAGDPVRKCGVMPEYRYDDASRIFTMRTMEGVKTVDGVDQDLAAAAMAARNVWTSFLPGAKVEKLYQEFFAEDYERFRRLARGCVNGSDLPAYGDDLAPLSASEYGPSET